MNSSKKMKFRKKIFKKIARYLRLYIFLALSTIHDFAVETGIEKFVEKQQSSEWITPKANSFNDKKQQVATSLYQIKPKSKLKVQRKRIVEKRQQEKNPEKEQLLDEQKTNFRLSPEKQVEKIQDLWESIKIVSNQIRDIRNKGVNDLRFLKFDHNEVEYAVFKNSKHIWKKWKDSLTNPPNNFEICFANIDVIEDIDTTKEQERVEKIVCKCGKALPGIKYLVEFKIRADSASEKFKDVAEIKLTLQSLDCRLLVSKANQKIIQISFVTKEF